MVATEQNFPPKDRRMLVLFLFGFFLLACDFAASSRFLVSLFVDDHPKARMRVSHVVDFQGIARGPGQGDGREGQLSPQLSFFLDKPMAINRASRRDLVLLPGIGEHLSARILAYRHQHGPIHTLAELEKVPGISRKLGRKISWMISFDSAGDVQSIHAD